MSFEGAGIQKKKPPVLTSHEESDARLAFAQEVIDELILNGHDTEEHRRIALSLATNATVTSRFGGPEVRLNTSSEVGLKPKRVATLVVETAKVRSYGADPVTLLVERLVKLGVPQENAAQLAKGKVGRHLDGRVWAQDAGRDVYDGGPTPPADVAPASDAYAKFTDPNEAVTRMTRILLQRYRDEQARATSNTSHSIVRGAF